MKRAFDKRYYDEVWFGLGEVVVMKRQPKQDEPAKVQTKYRVNPMQVIKVLPSDTYRVAYICGDEHMT